MPIRNLGIDIVHASVRKQKRNWKRVRDAVAGEESVHNAGPAYLPKLRGETDGDYGARKGRTPWYNATWRTMAALIGMIYRKDPQVTVPPGLEEMLKDVTMTGVPFVNFLKELSTEIVGPGLVGILVDHPAAPEASNTPLTVERAERLGLRPTMSLYKAESFINWKHRRINNAWVLSQLRLMETANIEDGEFGEKEVQQIRVLDLNPEAGDTYRVRLFRKSDAGEWVQFGGDVVPLMNGQPLTAIPFFSLTANGLVLEVDEPPMVDLVDLNYKHYGVSADYEHGCHWTALPTPWIAGLKPKFGEDGKPVPQAFYVGGTKAWTFENSDAKVDMLEFSGAGIEKLEQNLARKEAQMAALGARLLAPEKKAAEAADTVGMRHSGEQSVLSAIAEVMDLGGGKALELFAQWAGQSGETKVTVNKNFMAVIMDSAMLTALMSAWQGGGLSEQEFYELLQKGELIKPEKPFEDHQAEIQDNPPMGIQAAQAGIDALAEDGKNKDDKGDEE